MLSFQIKSFFKNRVMRYSFVVYILYVGYLIWVNYNPAYPDALIQTIMMQIPITFLLFQMVSFSHFSRTDQYVRETVVGGGRSCWKDYLSGISILVVISFVISLSFFLLFVKCIKDGSSASNTAWLFMLAKMIIIYHFLTYIFAILLGCAISFIRNQNKAYMMLVLSYCSFSDSFTCILGDYGRYHPWVKKLPSFFSIINRDYTCMLDGYYQYSVEAVNVERVMLWIVIMAGVLCWILCQKHKKIIMGIAGICFGIAMALFVRPAGFFYNDTIVSSWGEDEEYYHLLDAKITGKDTHVSTADYKVKGYAGELVVNRELHARVYVEVDHTGLDQYDFTLYHGFCIKHIYDDDRELDFVQKGDHITVYSPGGLYKNSITFEYSGYSSCYYSTAQATFLPGYFCYLPFPGHRLVWFEGEELENGMTDMSRCDDLSGIGYPVDYDMTINLAQDFYCNLEKNSKGHYTGKSNGLTLLASPFARKYSYRGVTFIYPMSYDWNSEFQEICRKAVEQGNRAETLSGYTIFIPPDVSRWIFFVGDNHLIMNVSDINAEYKTYEETGKIPYPSFENSGGTE